MEGQATPLGRDKRRIRRALGDESCDGGRRGRRTDGGAGLGRRGQATDAAWRRAADAEGTRDGCGGGDRRRMRRGQATDGQGVGGRAAGQATCESATQGGGGGGVRHWQRASRDAEARLHGERDAEANRWGVPAIYSSDTEARYGGALLRHDTAAILRLDTVARCSMIQHRYGGSIRRRVAAA